jgi:hypothetical protein
METRRDRAYPPDSLGLAQPREREVGRAVLGRRMLAVDGECEMRRSGSAAVLAE